MSRPLSDRVRSFDTTAIGSRRLERQTDIDLHDHWAGTHISIGAVPDIYGHCCRKRTSNPVPRSRGVCLRPGKFSSTYLGTSVFK